MASNHSWAQGFADEYLEIQKKAPRQHRRVGQQGYGPRGDRPPEEGQAQAFADRRTSSRFARAAPRPMRPARPRPPRTRTARPRQMRSCESRVNFFTEIWISYELNCEIDSLNASAES